MSKKKKLPKSAPARSSKPKKGLVGVMLAAALGVGALSVAVMNGPGRTIPAAEQRSERLPEHQDPSLRKGAPDKGNVSPDANEGKVTILKPQYSDQGDLSYTKRDEDVPVSQDKFKVAINGYLKEAKVSPPEAALEMADLKDGRLTLHFNNAFDTTYGTEDEETLVDGILRTCGQFAEVKEVKFTIMGRDLETLGNIDLTQPMPPLRP